LLEKRSRNNLKGVLGDIFSQRAGGNGGLGTFLTIFKMEGYDNERNSRGREKKSRRALTTTVLNREELEKVPSNN